MASRRINAFIRDNIIAALLKQGFESQTRELIIVGQRLADEVFIDLVGKANIKRLNELPKGWVPSISYFTVNCEGQKHKMGFNGQVSFGAGDTNLLKTIDRDWLKTQKFAERRIPYTKLERFSTSSTLGSLTADNELCQRVQGLAQDREDLKEQYKAARRQALATLKSVTTIKRLIDIWPEVEPYASPFEFGKGSNPTSSALTLPTAQLNEMLGLKSAA